MIPLNDERHPQVGAPSNVLDHDAATAPQSRPSVPKDADLLNGVLVLVVAHHEDGEVRRRRRVFYSIAAAQRAADRAVERGHHPSITLCRLLPVEDVPGRWDG